MTARTTQAAQLAEEMRQNEWEGRAQRIAAQHHLASLSPERRAELERAWLADQWQPFRTTPETKARADQEWDAL